MLVFVVGTWGGCCFAKAILSKTLCLVTKLVCGSLLAMKPMLTEQHCHLSGLVTASDVVAICESWPVDASLAVVGGGAGILALARQGEKVLAQRWCLKPVPPSSHRGWSGW